MTPAPPQSYADLAPHSAETDTPPADHRPNKPRRPIVPMTASEAIAMVFVELGLLILLADYSGLFLIVPGLIGYLYGRLTYTPALAPAVGHPTLLDTLTDNAVMEVKHPGAKLSQRQSSTDQGAPL